MIFIPVIVVLLDMRDFRSKDWYIRTAYAVPVWILFISLFVIAVITGSSLLTWGFFLLIIYYEHSSKKPKFEPPLLQPSSSPYQHSHLVPIYYENPKPNDMQAENFNYCPGCGTRIEYSSPICPACGAIIPS